MGEVNGHNKNGLPKGWEWNNLGDVTTNFDGKRIPLSKEVRAKRQGQYRYYGATEIVDYIDDFIFDGEYLLIGEDGANLVSKSRPLAFIVDGKFWVNNHAHVLKTKDQVSQKYLCYYFNSLNLAPYVSGSAQPKLNQANLNKIPIPIPSRDEQQQIVSKIEELFSELDKSIEQLKTAQQQLKAYRQSVLKWAFEGKLTEDWRRTNNNTVPAIEYLKAVLNKRQGNKNDKKGGVTFSVGEIKTWGKAELNNLIYIAGRIGWRGLKKDEYTNEGPYFLSVHSLNYGKYVNFKEAFHISQERYEESPEIMLQNEDILLCKDGAGIGKIGIIKKLPGKATVNSSLLVIRGLEVFIPEFLFYLFKGPKLQKIVQERITGSATPHLFQNDIRNFELDIPPIAEQKEIVQEIESRFSVTDKLEETIANSLQQAEALRQSILKKAFEGKLIQQKIYKPKRLYFYQTQTIAYLNYYSNKYGVKHGEMTLAKYAYLIDKLYGIPTYYSYKRWHLGPYPPEIKKVVNNKNFFKVSKGNIEIANSEKLFSYNNPHKQQVEDAVKDLAKMFSKYSERERSYKTELLATVCKVIEDIKSDDLLEIRNSMKEWKIDLSNSKFKNKAEKFTEEEVNSCLKLIRKKGWSSKLVVPDLKK